MRTLLIAASALLLFACNSSRSSDEGADVAAEVAPPLAVASAEPVATAANGLTRVEDVSQVCMVNDQFMGRPQIPVAVSGKTYFGCCEMCKTRLANDATARTAKDPVSGNVVDKSSAVIGKRASGEVLYFESAQNLAQYKDR